MFSFPFGGSANAVGIAIGCGVDDRGVAVRVPIGARIYTSPYRPDGSGVIPASNSLGTWASLPRYKAAGA